MEYGASLLRFMPRASGSRADRARLHRCDQPRNRRRVRSLSTAQHPSAGSAALPFLGTAPLADGSTLLVPRHRPLSFYRRCGRSAVYPDGSDPQLYRVNTTLSVMFRTCEANYLRVSVRHNRADAESRQSWLANLPAFLNKQHRQRESEIEQKRSGYRIMWDR